MTLQTLRGRPVECPSCTLARRARIAAEVERDRALELAAALQERLLATRQWLDTSETELRAARAEIATLTQLRRGRH